MSTARTPGMPRAAETSMATMRACGCGLRSVAPYSMPSRERSLPYRNSPLHLRRRVDPRSGIADDAAQSLFRRSERHAPKPLLRRTVHGFEDLPVPGAAADVAGQRLADLGVGRLGVVAQERGGRDDEARRAEAALHRAGVDERALHRMHLLAVGEILDRAHVAALGGAREDETRAHELAVHQHRARSAFALLAGVLASPETEPLAQHGEQALVLARLRLALAAVDLKLQPHSIDHTRARARAPMTASTCRRYAAVPR